MIPVNIFIIVLLFYIYGCNGKKYYRKHENLHRNGSSVSVETLWPHDFKISNNNVRNNNNKSDPKSDEQVIN